MRGRGERTGEMSRVTPEKRNISPKRNAERIISPNFGKICRNEIVVLPKRIYL